MKLREEEIASQINGPSEVLTTKQTINNVREQAFIIQKLKENIIKKDIFIKELEKRIAEKN